MPSSTPASVAASAQPLLAVKNLKVTFRTEQGLVRAVDGVSFDIGEREILGIVGESGSGKSVSLMSIVGLIVDPNVEIEGSILYKGRELVGLSQAELRHVRGREIAVVFQDPMTALTPVYSIGMQIAEQIRTHQKISRVKARARAAELLDAVGIPEPKAMLGRFPHQLSGGMRQRAVIAMALSCDPSLLIADEPTTALDVTVQAQILDLIRKLRQDFGSAVIIVTHDMGVVAEVTDRVMVMYAGRVVEAAKKHALFADPRHPYTWGLHNSIPPLEGERPRRLPAIPGAPPSLLSLPKGCAFQPRCAHSFTACLARPTLSGEGDHLVACFLSEAERQAIRAKEKVLA